MSRHKLLFHIEYTLLIYPQISGYGLIELAARTVAFNGQQPVLSVGILSESAMSLSLISTRPYVLHGGKVWGQVFRNCGMPLAGVRTP